MTFAKPLTVLSKATSLTIDAEKFKLSHLLFLL